MGKGKILRNGDEKPDLMGKGKKIRERGDEESIKKKKRWEGGGLR